MSKRKKKQKQVEPNTSETEEVVGVDEMPPDHSETVLSEQAAENMQATDNNDVEIDIGEPESPLDDFAAPDTMEADEQTLQPSVVDSDPPPEVEILQDIKTMSLPEPGGAGSQPAPFDPSQTHIWQALVTEYEREISAIGELPDAATLYYESGKIFEDKLAQPHNAWGYYKKAFQLQPSFMPNIRAARRLASQMGNWKATVLVLDSEIQATQDSERKASLIYQRGRIMEEKLENPDEALAMYEEAAELAPSNPQIIKQLEKIYISNGDWKKVIEAREKLISLVQDPSVKVQLLSSCAKMAQFFIQDNVLAEELYKRVLEIDGNNLETYQALKVIYETSGKYEQMLDVLVQQAKIESDPADAAWIYYQAARLFRDKIGDEERALECLKEALELAPDNYMVLVEMAHIYEGFMRWQDLVAVYTQQTKHVTDQQELVSLYFRLGNIWEEKLFEEDRAIENYHNVIDLNPSYLPALQALGKLYYRKGQWEDLVRMYEVELQTNSDYKARSSRLYKVAEILEERLNRDEDSIKKLEECIQQSPGFLPALKSLGRLYTKYNRWEDLISMYEKELEWCKDLEQSMFILDKVGNIWEEKLGDIDKAIQTYKRLIDLSPNHLPAVRTLGKLYAKADRWHEMIQINQVESQLVNDLRQTVSLLHRNGEILEEKLNDKEQAINTYKEVLALMPNYLPALQNLGRIYFVKGCWADLVDMYRQEIDITTSSDQKFSLLYKIGELYEGKLVQEERAIETYKEVLDLEANNFPAIKALIRIYTNRRDWQGLIDIYTQQARFIEDPRQKSLTLFQMAEIWCSYLNQQDKAIRTLLSVLELVPDHMPSIEFLERLYIQTEGWSELLKLYERELNRVTDQLEQIELLSRMADIYAGRLNDLARAAECHEKVLSIQPNNLTSLEVLERIYLSRRDYTALLRIYEACAAATVDMKLQLALQSQIAEIKENRVRPPQNAGENHLRILEIDSLHPDAIRSLEMLYNKYGTWNGLQLLYERELTDARNLDEAVDLCLRIADLAETRLRNADVGEHYYKEALRIKPDYLPAIKALKRIKQTNNDYQGMIALLEQEGRITCDPEQAVAILLQAANVYLEHFRDVSKAIRCLSAVLDRNPTDDQAFNQMEALLTQDEDLLQLAVLYRKRIEASADEAVLTELYLKLGKLLRHSPQNAREVAACYQKVLELDSSNVTAQAEMAELSFELEEWESSIQFNKEMLKAGCDNDMMVKAHLRLGIIYHEKIPDFDSAVDHLRSVLRIHPNERPALVRLKEIYTSREEWQEAVDAMIQLAGEEEEVKQKVTYLEELAGVYEKGLHDPEKASETYLQMLEIEPDNTETIKKLGEIYESLERWQELIETYHSFTRLLPMERVEEAIPLHMKMGFLYASELDNTEKAILEYKRVVMNKPDHVEARKALAGLYGKSNVFYANAMDEHRKLLETDPFRLESYHELRRILEEQRAYDKVLCVCAVLHVLRDANQDEEFFFGENRSKVPERSTEKLSLDEKEAWLVHPSEKGITRKILKILAPFVGKVFPPDLERYGVGKGNRALSGDPLHTLCSTMADNLGPGEFDIYRSNQPTYLVSIETTSPIGMIVGEGLVKRTVVKEQRFAVGRGLKLISDGSFLALKLGHDGLAKFIAAVVSKFKPDSPYADCPPEFLGDMSKRLMKVLPRKQRKLLEELMQKESNQLNEQPDYETYLQAVAHSANRAGLAMCNDLPQAVMHLLRENSKLQSLRMTTVDEVVYALSQSESICRLINFSVSEEYFRLRARLKYSISG